MYIEFEMDLPKFSEYIATVVGGLIERDCISIDSLKQLCEVIRGDGSEKTPKEEVIAYLCIKHSSY